MKKYLIFLSNRKELTSCGRIRLTVLSSRISNFLGQSEYDSKLQNRFLKAPMIKMTIDSGSAKPLENDDGFKVQRMFKNLMMRRLWN
jgi:hypothetical protein